MNTQQQYDQAKEAFAAIVDMGHILDNANCDAAEDEMAALEAALSDAYTAIEAYISDIDSQGGCGAVEAAVIAEMRYDDMKAEG